MQNGDAKAVNSKIENRSYTMARVRGFIIMVCNRAPSKHDVCGKRARTWTDTLLQKIYFKNLTQSGLVVTEPALVLVMVVGFQYGLKSGPETEWDTHIQLKASHA